MFVSVRRPDVQVSDIDDQLCFNNKGIPTYITNTLIYDIFSYLSTF
jgi:hypothetical protein